ncbi:MAG: helix-turn-helix domain-containing protein, partial [Mariprofundaceae bacterium]|nr:helix-turn-helix domain-containing protein [Mariprofundaceae bacterium]
MFPCPKCSHVIATKSGVIKSRQRWKCKSCGYNYTVASRGASKEQKRQALELYLEGLGFRSIGRLLKVSHVSVYNWIRAFGEKLDEIKSDANIKVVEIDEMHSYIGQK